MVGIYKRKQEKTLSTKRAIKKKTNKKKTLSTKKETKKKRKKTRSRPRIPTSEDIEMQKIAEGLLRDGT